ncbi:hypothetical protein L345_17088, partial [Ophiophagus hannah]
REVCPSSTLSVWTVWQNGRLPSPPHGPGTNPGSTENGGCFQDTVMRPKDACPSLPPKHEDQRSSKAAGEEEFWGFPEELIRF